jgi:hypothetical protein
MTVKNKFKLNVKYVLEKLKERSLYIKKGGTLEYVVLPEIVSGLSVSAADEVAILEKLEEWGVIKILNPGGEELYAD